MQYNQFVSLCLVALVLGQASALPQHPQYDVQYPQQYQQVRDQRKFAEKPNAMKKVALDDLEDVSTNQIQEGNGGGFSWSNMLSMVMHMLLGQTGGVAGPSKNDIDDGAPPSPWANMLSVGLRVLSALLGGPQQQADGIDKVDNQSSPLQGVLTAVLGAFLGQGRDPDQVAVMAKQASEFIGIVMNLLDALKTSFSHRSLTARSMGRRDTISEAAVASISMLKGYVRSMKSFSGIGRAEDEGQRGCAERALCEANAECTADTQGQSSIFCQLGSYATSYLLQRQSGVAFETLSEAGRRGRSETSHHIVHGPGASNKREHYRFGDRDNFGDKSVAKQSFTTVTSEVFLKKVPQSYYYPKMTFKSLLNFGSFGRNPTEAVDRYHSGPSDYGHYDHGWGHGGHKGKGGSGGAALSALTLLAFLFLINVMQQSLDNNNGTAAPAVVREGDQSAAPRARGDQASTNIVINDSIPSVKYVPIKTSLQVVRNKN